MLRPIGNKLFRKVAKTLFDSLLANARQGRLVRFPAADVQIISYRNIKFNAVPCEEDTRTSIRLFGETLYELAGGNLSDAVNDKYPPLEGIELWPLIEMLLSGKSCSLPTIEAELQAESVSAKLARKTAGARQMLANISSRSASAAAEYSSKLLGFARRNIGVCLVMLIPLIMSVALWNYVPWRWHFFGQISTLFFIVVYVALNAFIFIASIGLMDEKSKWLKTSTLDGLIGVILTVVLTFLLVLECFMAPFYGPSPNIGDVGRSGIHNRPVLVDRSNGQFVARLSENTADHFLTHERYSINLFKYRIVEGLPVRGNVNCDLTDNLEIVINYELTTRDRYIAAFSKWGSYRKLEKDLFDYLTGMTGDIAASALAAPAEAALDMFKPPADYISTSSQPEQSEYKTLCEDVADRFMKNFPNDFDAFKVVIRAKNGN